MADVNWHSLKVDDLLHRVESGSNGLSSSEAEKRLSVFGANEIRGQRGETALDLFIAQFKNFLVIILIASSVVSAGIGFMNGSDEDLMEAAAILVVVLFIAVTGFIQEYRAGKELEALKKMVAPTALVLRSGRKERIHAKYLVRGDVVLLEAGDKIPADCRLLEAINMRVDEASLTGESMPVEKDCCQLGEESSLGDRSNMLFMGTSVTYGKGSAVVVDTGMGTQLGRIAEKIQTMEKERTPLQIKLDTVGKQIGMIVFVLCAIIFLAGTLGGKEPIFMFLVAVALAVAAVPEGLPAVVTVTLARGMRLMVKKNAIVRKMTAVETLGSTDVICSDKTGTLTRNEMTIRKIYVAGKTIEVTGEGYMPEGEFLVGGKKIESNAIDLQLILRIGSLCNNSSLEKSGDTWKITGDPTEASIIVAASKADVDQERMNQKFPRIAELPFDSERKRMTTVHKTPEGKVAYVKGAADVILNLCGFVYDGGKERTMSEGDRRSILSMNDQFAGNALRVLGAAYRRVDHIDDLTVDLERDLVFVGLLGMIDPPRDDAKKAVILCKKAGIKPIMITGDHKLTAVAVAKELGMFADGDRALIGIELERMTDAELKAIVDEVTIYARVSPEHKLRIVAALKDRGHIVAMTGDGVNDAPALKKADIGIAMGITGTDVAKEASDMVLTDDNFASIVAAVAEGRGIYDNIKLFIKYLLSCNIGEVAVIFIGMMFLGKLPLTALQILWMNLLTDAAPALALGWNPADPDIMDRKPRDPKEQIITKRTIMKFSTVGSLMCAGTLLAFTYGNPDEIKAQTLAFTTIIMFQMFYALSCRSEKSIFSVGVFSNKYLILAIASSLLLQVAVINLPFLQTIMQTTALSLGEWLMVTVIASSAFFIPEIMKYKRWFV